MKHPLPVQIVLAQLATGAPVSGAELARRLKLTRAAVWKHVAALRASGLPVEAQPGVGYRLPWPVELLDAEKIRHHLHQPARAPLHVCWALASTQDELARHQDAWPDMTVVLAEQQTHGRGRRGRDWCSPPALSIYLSCLKRFAGGPAALSGLSLAVGVSLVRALQRLGVSGLLLKWPNDVIAPQGKLAGILIELTAEAEGPSVARVGVGLNLRLPDALRATLDQPAADLMALYPQALMERNRIAATLIDQLHHDLIRFDAHGFSPFSDDFRALDSLHGRPLQLHTANGMCAGVGRGINVQGALLVDVDGRRMVVHSGEVSVRAAS